MATDEDIRSYTLADAAVAAITSEYYQNTVPDDATLPFIWCRRSRVEYGDWNNAREAQAEWFDIECVSDDLDEAINLADAVRDRLEGATGTLGSANYPLVSTHDQFDEYIPRNTEASENLHVVSLIVEATLP